MTKKQLIELLTEIYNEDGPRERNRVVPPAKFAKMDQEGIDKWDFDRRFLMHRVAKAIAQSLPRMTTPHGPESGSLPVRR